MAWYEIEYRCGHTEREQLYGPTRLREQRIEREHGRLCPTCYKAEQAKNNAALADRVEAEMGLPPLQGGSDSQINWARAIRANTVGLLAQIAGDETTATLEVPHADIVRFCKLILKQINTQYWLDRREKFATKDRALFAILSRLREDKLKASGKQVLGLGGGAS